MADNKRILLVDDHPMVLCGIESLFARELPQYRLLKADSGRKAAGLAEKTGIDMAIVDVELPDMDGLQLIAQLRALQPDMRFIVHTMHEEPWMSRELAEAGVNAIVLKGDQPGELLMAVESMAMGMEFFSHRFLSLAECSHPLLTGRELDIIRLMADGLSSSVIADRLFISVNTVEYHRKRIMRKLQAANSVDMVRKAMQKGFLRP
ncbi:MAG: response regulator [Prevotella sp.]